MNSYEQYEADCERWQEVRRAINRRTAILADPRGSTGPEFLAELEELELEYRMLGSRIDRFEAIESGEAVA